MNGPAPLRTAGIRFNEKENVTGSNTKRTGTDIRG